MLSHAWSTTEREVGGIVLGEVFRDEEPYILLTQAIAAGHNHEGRARLTFTQASWQQMLAEKEARCPSARILGWYHTHPGYGIFLSEHDQYITRNFFSLPFQVAFVFDPIARTFGYFHWAGQTLAVQRTLAICGDECTPALAATLQNQAPAMAPPREPPPIILDDAIEELALAIHEGCTFFGQSVGDALATCCSRWIRPLRLAPSPGPLAQDRERGPGVRVRARSLLKRRIPHGR